MLGPYRHPYCSLQYCIGYSVGNSVSLQAKALLVEAQQVQERPKQPLRSRNKWPILVHAPTPKSTPMTLIPALKHNASQHEVGNNLRRT
jgi:hypothetical protein